MHEKINLTREVSAIQIPSGDALSLPAGTEVYITQRLGGTYTVATSQGLARISSQDTDALGVNLEEEAKKTEAAEKGQRYSQAAAATGRYRHGGRR